jgi:hypothetical protein
MIPVGRFVVPASAGEAPRNPAISKVGRFGRLKPGLQTLGSGGLRLTSSQTLAPRNSCSSAGSSASGHPRRHGRDASRSGCTKLLLVGAHFMVIPVFACEGAFSAFLSRDAKLFGCELFLPFGLCFRNLARRGHGDLSSWFCGSLSRGRTARGRWRITSSQKTHQRNSDKDNSHSRENCNAIWNLDNADRGHCIGARTSASAW